MTSSALHPRVELSSVRPAVIAPARLTWTVATSVHADSELVDAWSHLRSLDDQATLNNLPDRFAATVQALSASAQPFIACGCYGDAPAAIILGRRSTRQTHIRTGYCTIRFMRLRCLDIVHGGVITDGSAETAVECAAFLHSLLRDGGDVEHITLNHLRVDKPLYAAMGSLPGVVAQCADPHWTTALRQDHHDDFFQRFSKKHRYNIRRTDRLLVERFNGKVDLKVITSPHDVDSFRKAALSIMAAGYQASLAAGYTDSAAQQALLHTEAHHGRLRSYLLMADEQPIAFQLGVLHHGRYHIEATAYRAEHRALSPGSVLLLRVMQDLFEQGADTVDYGFGDAPYKAQYGSDMCLEQSLHLYAAAARPMIAHAIARAHQIGDNMLRRTMQHARLSERFRRMWRSHLESTARPQGIVPQ